jgi:hypothetical protein
MNFNFKMHMEQKNVHVKIPHEFLSRRSGPLPRVFSKNKETLIGGRSQVSCVGTIGFVKCPV